MQITRLKVETFKSLYDVECHFGDFNVVTGPNGSGKSNLVDALRFLGDTYTHGLEFAVSRAGGIENIAHRRTRRAKRAIGFMVTGVLALEELDHYWMRHPQERDDLLNSGDSVVIEHSFSFKTHTQTVRADFVIESEELKLTTPDGHLLAHLLREDDGYRVTTRSGPRRSVWRKSVVSSLLRPFTDQNFIEFMKARSSPTGLIFSDTPFTGSLAGAFARYIADIAVFQLSPHVSRTPGVATPNARLEQHGENLPGAAFNLIRNNTQAWDRVQEAMRLLLPNLESIEIANTEDRRLALQFRESGVGRAWTAGEVSDGTIQSLALLVALFDPRTPLVVIEEPENAIHPWILRNFIDLCRATRKQLLFTSHSPILLDYVSPEVIQLVWMKDGRSQIKPLLSLNPDASAALLAGDVSVFDLYDSGLIRQAVPRGLASLEADE